MLICICSLENVRETEFVILLRDYSKATNNHLKSDDPEQQPKHIIYLDANILYGYAMSKVFPTKLI